MAEPLRVLIADDQRRMRSGLRILLELEPGIEVVGGSRSTRPQP